MSATRTIGGPTKGISSGLTHLIHTYLLNNKIWSARVLSGPIGPLDRRGAAQRCDATRPTLPA
jgi:hypothetical protein